MIALPLLLIFALLVLAAFCALGLEDTHHDVNTGSTNGR